MRSGSRQSNDRRAEKDAESKTRAFGWRKHGYQTRGRWSLRRRLVSRRYRRRSDRMTPHTAPLVPLAGKPTVEAVLDKFVAAPA